MSGTVSLIGPGETILYSPTRQIGTILPECTIEERHTDRLEITHHPVELGANITDHAFRQPFEISLRYGWSNALGGLFGDIREVYDQLQRLQQDREPFDVLTGKRIYQNMLLSDLEVTTDQHTENVLMIEAHCQEVIIVQTSAVPAANPQTQTAPESTQSQTNVGQQQLKPAAKPAVKGLSTGPVNPSITGFAAQPSLPNV